MKRLLPMTRKGEVALAASRLPPVTALANRHRPSTAQPGRPAAAVNAALTAADRVPAPVRQRPHHLPAQLDGQRREAHRQLPGPRREPADPAPRRRIRHPRRGRRRAHPARRRPRPARSPRRPPPPHPAARPARTPAAAHESPRTAAPQPRHEDPPAPPPPADMPPVTRPEHHRPAHDGQSGRGTFTARPSSAYTRPSAGTAIPWTWRITASDPFSRQAANPGEEGSLALTDRSTTILNRAGQSPAARITKEHSQNPVEDAQPIRPSTHPRPRVRRSACRATHSGRAGWSTLLARTERPSTSSVIATAKMPSLSAARRSRLMPAMWR